MKQYRLLVTLGFVVLFLSSCSLSRSLPRSLSPRQAWQQRRLALQALENWHLEGRLAIHVVEVEKVWTGSLHWTQQGRWFKILWIAPFGQGSVELYGNREKVTLRLPNRKPLTAASAEQLLRRRLGWSLPVSGLRFWLIGLPAPSLPIADMALDSKGRLVRLSQGGWHIRYLDYTSVDGYTLPRKIFMNHPKLRLRLVIDDWRLK